MEELAWQSPRLLYLLDLHLERHIYFSASAETCLTQQGKLTEAPCCAKGDETVVVENTEGEECQTHSGCLGVLGTCTGVTEATISACNIRFRAVAGASKFTMALVQQ